MPNLYSLAPSNELVDQQMNVADTLIERGINPFRSLSYADGVAAALRWAVGLEDDPPFSAEDLDAELGISG